MYCVHEARQPGTGCVDTVNTGIIYFQDFWHQPFLCVTPPAKGEWIPWNPQAL